MKLVNVDNVKGTIVNDLQPDGFVVSREMISIDKLKKEPAVEAIPVEWLLEWEKNYNEELLPEFRGATVIGDVIRDWRKENE